jgi:hypothetical protein
MLTAALSAALVMALSGAAGAYVNPVVDFGADSYAREGTRVVLDYTSTAGDVLTIVGKVVDFNDPFADLDPNAAGVEYTYIMTGLVSMGTAPLSPPYPTNYAGGTFRIYEDTSPDADFANLATFQDGTLILEGAFSGFHTTAISRSGTQNSDFQFTGGSLFSRVSQYGVGFIGINTGLFSVHTDFVPLDQQNQGYFGMSDTKLDVTQAVATEPSTWGRIKNQY